MQARVLATLQSGKELTSAQLTKFGLSNPSAAISQLRAAGATIYANTRTTKAGVKFSAWRMNVK